ncbi:MAG: YihA family ribosome biogenesis GTP-binding protein [Deltaproteobacteria bacterium]|nr:YihA family ribosome biogenesis GTP-binding protein [Deltaproteobacteria bacterium]
MNIKIRDAKYVGTIYNNLKILPEVAFIGRSNVGKSSLINALLHRKNLVKTSKSPGKTRNVNFFQIDFIGLPSIYMVDLPGYGYSKVSRAMKKNWHYIVERYFTSNRDLRLAIILVDIRRGMEEEEIAILRMLEDAHIRCVVAATKIDKIGISQRQKGGLQIQKACGLSPLLCSSVSGQGISDFWKEIRNVLSMDRQRYEKVNSK